MIDGTFRRRERSCVLLSMGKIHKIAGLRITRVDPALRVKPVEELVEEEVLELVPAAAEDVFPTLEPAEDRLARDRAQIFRSDAISLSQASAMEEALDPLARAEPEDLVARLTVYAMNLTVMVFALPVGLMLLLLNILGGENLRTTAHVMALTGMFLALAAVEGAIPALPLL